MDFSNVDPVALAALTFAVAGVVELYKRVVNEEYSAAGTIAVAAVAGAILAPFAGDVNWFSGMLIGFSASGVITTITHFR